MLRRRAPAAARDRRRAGRVVDRNRRRAADVTQARPSGAKTTSWARNGGVMVRTSRGAVATETSSTRKRCGPSSRVPSRAACHPRSSERWRAGPGHPDGRDDRAARRGRRRATASRLESLTKAIRSTGVHRRVAGLAEAADLGDDAQGRGVDEAEPAERRMGNERVSEAVALDAAWPGRGRDALHDSSRRGLDRDEARLEIGGDERDGAAPRGSRAERPGGGEGRRGCRRLRSRNERRFMQLIRARPPPEVPGPRRALPSVSPDMDLSSRITS